MENNITRRSAVAGFAALASTIVPTVSIATPNADEKLFDLFRQWERGKALEISFGEEHNEMDRLARAKEPTVPQELLQPIEGVSIIEPSGPRGWTEAELNFVASLATIPQSAQTKVTELLAIKKRYDKVNDAVWSEAEAGQKRFDEIVSDNSDLILCIAATPANTLQGVIAKCHICQTEKLLVYFSDFTEMAQSIVEDIERLAPQLTAKV